MIADQHVGVYFFSKKLAQSAVISFTLFFTVSKFFIVYENTIMTAYYFKYIDLYRELFNLGEFKTYKHYNLMSHPSKDQAD